MSVKMSNSLREVVAPESGSEVDTQLDDFSFHAPDEAVAGTQSEASSVFLDEVQESTTIEEQREQEYQKLLAENQLFIMNQFSQTPIGKFLASNGKGAVRVATWLTERGLIANSENLQLAIEDLLTDVVGSNLGPEVWSTARRIGLDSVEDWLIYFSEEVVQRALTENDMSSEIAVRDSLQDSALDLFEYCRQLGLKKEDLAAA